MARKSPVRTGILSVASGAPEHELPQSRARAFAANFFAEDFTDPAEFEQLLQSFDHTGIRTRQLAVPAAWLARPRSFAEKNAVYMAEAVRLARGVAEQALVASNIERRDVGAILFVSSTGIATPSLDARLLQELDLPRAALRVPLWGLGCAGGSAALLRAWALARGLGRPVLAVVCELCSLTFVQKDRRKANVIAAALFGDGAAATVVAPEPWWTPDQGPELLGGTTRLLDATEDVMGWDLEEGGLRVRFSPAIPEIVREHAADVVRACRHGAGLSDDEPLAHWILHPGGRKVLEAYEAALALGPQQLGHARSVLRDHGNMSSATVLFVLERFLESTEASGRPGLVLGLGPGFCAEGVVFRW